MEEKQKCKHKGEEWGTCVEEKNILEKVGKYKVNVSVDSIHFPNSTKFWRSY